jgi:hypothetical protein
LLQYGNAEVMSTFSSPAFGNLSSALSARGRDAQTTIDGHSLVCRRHNAKETFYLAYLLCHREGQMQGKEKSRRRTALVVTAILTGVSQAPVAIPFLSTISSTGFWVHSSKHFDHKAPPFAYFGGARPQQTMH